MSSTSQPQQSPQQGKRSARNSEVTACTRCFLSEEKRDECPDKDILGCPTPVTLSTSEVVEISCGPCRKHLVVPIANLMRQERVSQLGQCERAKCAARVIHPTDHLQARGPAPLKG